MFFPCTHSGKVEQASKVLRRLGPRRPSHHKDADTREALQATLTSPCRSFHDHLLQSGRSSQRQVLESSYDQPTLSGPKQGLSVDSLFLISFLC